MSVHSDLLRLFQEKMSNYDQTSKDMILYRYGFIDGIFHTLDETGQRYLDPETKNKRERPRQPIAVFKQAMNDSSLPTIPRCASLLAQQQFWTCTEYMQALANAGLLADSLSANPMGLLSLMAEMNISTNFSIYDQDLTPVSNLKAFPVDTNAFLIHATKINPLKSALSKARRSLGKNGLVSVKYLSDSLSNQGVIQQEILEILKSQEGIVFINWGDDHYYFLPFGKNTLLESLDRVFSVIEQVELNQLARALGATLQVPVGVILEFLQNYPDIICVDGHARYVSNRKTPNQIDLDIKTFFQAKSIAEFGEIRDYLEGKGHQRSNIISSVMQSPLVIKSGPRKAYRYSLIGIPDMSIEFEDAIQSGMDDPALLGILKGRMSQDDFDKALEASKTTGLAGEKLVNQYLLHLKLSGEIKEAEWVSDKQPFAPYDFIVTGNDGTRTYIDVKASKNQFNARIHISYGELQQMTNAEYYRIYRVYELDDGGGAYLRISGLMHAFSTQIMKVFNMLPNGVISKGISLLPEELSFEPELEITVELQAGSETGIS